MLRPGNHLRQHHKLKGVELKTKMLEMVPVGNALPCDNNQELANDDFPDDTNVPDDANDANVTAF